jgi:hypothetical protein
VTCRQNFAAALFGAVLSACAPPPPDPSTPAPASAAPAADAAQQTAPADSRLSARFIGFVGAKLQHDPPFLGSPYSNFYCLRSFLDRQTGETAHQLYVADSYFGAERGWDGAHDGPGNALPFTHISTNKITCDNGCAYEEEFAATLPEAALRASAQGLSVTFTARSGNTMKIDLSGAQIASQLAAVDAERRRPPPQAAATAATRPSEVTK